jgi:hypothetical protein
MQWWMWKERESANINIGRAPVAVSPIPYVSSHVIGSAIFSPDRPSFGRFTAAGAASDAELGDVPVRRTGDRISHGSIERLDVDAAPSARVQVTWAGAEDGVEGDDPIAVDERLCPVLVDVSGAGKLPTSQTIPWFLMAFAVCYVRPG